MQLCLQRFPFPLQHCSLLWGFNVNQKAAAPNSPHLLSRLSCQKQLYFSAVYSICPVTANLITVPALNWRWNLTERNHYAGYISNRKLLWFYQHRITLNLKGFSTATLVPYNRFSQDFIFKVKLALDLYYIINILEYVSKTKFKKKSEWTCAMF